MTERVRPIVRLAAGSALAASLIAGCSGVEAGSAGAGSAAAGSAAAGSAGAGDIVPSAAAAADVSSPATGVVVAVDSSGLEDVAGFTLRTMDGVVVDIAIDGPLENAAEFPLGHLGEHAATAEPVRVWFRRSGDLQVATRIEDAG